MTVTDTYKNFSDLKSSQPKSFTINHENKNTSFLIFTPHGGGIEPGTTEICEWFNKNGFSYYSFNGTGKKCKNLHITSTRFDEPKLIKYLAKHNRAISFHGMTDYKKKQFNADIFLGGLDTKLRESIKKNLQKNGYSVTTSKEFPHSNLAARDNSNVTNRCAEGRGVQIELSETIRKSFFINDYRYKKGRTRVTNNFDNFCTIIKDTLE